MRTLLGLTIVFALSCAHAPAPLASDDLYNAAANAADRTPADRALDAGRKPAEFLRFLGVKPGMHVADLGAATGYTTELIARVVGANGVVYMQNAPSIVEHFAAGVSDRLAPPINAHVVRDDRPFEDPLPPEANNLDLLVMNIFYHDTVWQKVDRVKMNQAIFAALKPGGSFVVADTSAKAGTGTADVQTLHRIDEQVVRTEVAAAGFKLAAESDILRNPNDTRDWNASPRAAGERRGTNDRFLLRFVKP
jgi:predicted methyltransferase